MSDDKNLPVDGTIMVEVGGLKATGALAGLTVAETRKLVQDQVAAGLHGHAGDKIKELVCTAPVKIVTVDPESEAWTGIQSEEEESLVASSAPGSVTMIHAVAKIVPDDYVIRKADIYMKFLPKEDGNE